MYDVRIMRIAEIFQSIQGEGRYAGEPSVFVRATGCNLRCWFCDTAYTSWRPEGVHRDWQNVAEEAKNYDCRHVVVTGGEPLLQPDVVPLTKSLSEAGCFITVETAATVYRPVHADLMSISPKLSNSTPTDSQWAKRHDSVRDNPATIESMLDGHNCQFKFVIDQPGDLADVDVWLRRFPRVEPTDVFLMPQSTTAAEIHEKQTWLEPAAATRGFHVSPRLHVEWYGNVRGK